MADPVDMIVPMLRERREEWREFRRELIGELERVSGRLDPIEAAERLLAETRASNIAELRERFARSSPRLARLEREAAALPECL